VCFFTLLNVELLEEISKTLLKYTRSVEQELLSLYFLVARKYPNRKIRFSRALSKFNCVALLPSSVLILFVKFLRAKGSA
jgi:hypothetical protein